MLHRKALIAAVVALIVLTASAAYAQYESTNKSRIGIRAALYRPSGNKLSNIKSNWFGPAVDFHIQYDELDRPSLLATVGWFSEDSGPEQGRMTPITVSYIKRLGVAEEDTWYVGGGIGFYSLKFRGVETVTVGEQQFNTLTSDSGTEFGYHLMVGREFAGSWFAELRYDSIGELSREVGSDADFSGLSLSIGSRLAY